MEAWRRDWEEEYTQHDEYADHSIFHCNDMCGASKWFWHYVRPERDLQPD